MPGFTIIYQKDGLDESIVKRTNRLVEASFRIQYIINKEDLIVLFRDGNQYPFQVIKSGRHIILIEGKIYNINAVHDKDFINNVKAIAKTGDINLLDYFHSLDGEFIIYVINRLNRNVTMINDYMGRLPLYVWHQKRFILSRDIFVMDKVTTGLLFNESTVYQYLRLGFPLGKNTLFHDIDRVPGSSFLTIDDKGIRLREGSFDEVVFNGTHAGNEPEKALYELFRKAVKDRLQAGKKVVISLSGGMGSRLVAGEIEKSGYPADFATYTTETPVFGKEMEVVKKIGKHYEHSPHVTVCKTWSPEFFDELTGAKGGMNDFGRAFELQFLKDISSRFHEMITGYGMASTLAYLFPDVPVSKKKFAAYVLKKHRVSKIRTLDRFFLFDLKKEEKNMRELLLDLPAKNTTSKYKYFLLAEMARNLLFEEEDRDRSFIWSTSPFYNPEFYRLAHAIPEKLKRKYVLLEKFTRLVDPQLAEIPHAQWDFAIAEKQRVRKMIFREKLRHYFSGFKREDMDYDRQEEMATLVGSLMNKGYGGQLSMYANKYYLSMSREETLYHLIALLKVSEMSWKSV